MRHGPRNLLRARQTLLFEPGTRSRKFAKAVLQRVLMYGFIAASAGWWMLWTPGPGTVDSSRPPREEPELEEQLREDVKALAGLIGERNLTHDPEKREAAAGQLALS